MRANNTIGAKLAGARPFIVGFVLAAGATMLFVFDPRSARVYPPCPFHFVTGLYCPGCGSLRALHQLLHGNLAGALTLNPLMVVALPGLAILRLRASWVYRPWVAWFALAVLLTFGVVRNIPCRPFMLLAPR